MSQLSRLKDSEISNGNLIDADDLDSEFNQLVSESNDQDDRLTDLESNPMTINGVKTFSSAPKLDALEERTADNGVDIDGVALRDSSVKIATATNPSGLEDGMLWYNTTNDKLNLRTNGSTKSMATEAYVLENAGIPKGYLSPRSRAPLYVSAFSLSVPSFYGVDSTGAHGIDVTASTLVTINTNGLNGLAADATEAISTWYYLYAIKDIFSVTPTSGFLLSPKNVSGGDTLTGLPDDQSGLLTGTVSTTVGLDTITGDSTAFTSDFAAGQKIKITSGDTLTIQSVDSDTEMTATANATIASTTETYERLSPYNRYRQLPIAIRNDASGDFIPWQVASGWPHRPEVNYLVDTSYYSSGWQDGPHNVLSNGTATTATDVDLSDFIPPLSKRAVLQLLNYGNTTFGNIELIEKGGSETKRFMSGSSGAMVSSHQLTLKTDSSQVIQYKNNNIIGTGLDVTGYVVTEV